MNSEGILPENTGAGIDTVGVFSKVVRVEAVDGTLRINFPEEEHTPRELERRVQPNTPYS
jgi:hypothetical protein